MTTAPYNHHYPITTANNTTPYAGHHQPRLNDPMTTIHTTTLTSNIIGARDASVSRALGPFFFSTDIYRCTVCHGRVEDASSTNYHQRRRRGSKRRFIPSFWPSVCFFSLNLLTIKYVQIQIDGWRTRQSPTMTTTNNDDDRVSSRAPGKLFPLHFCIFTYRTTNLTYHHLRRKVDGGQRLQGIFGLFFSYFS